DTSAETAAWVEAQNAVTFEYLEQIPVRAHLKARLQQLYDYPRYFQPSATRDLIFFYRNDGLQNQNVLFVQKRLDGAPEVLIDPNAWSNDGTVRLVEFAPSRDARYAVYGISKSGSDWIEYNVLDLVTRTRLPDTIEWVKVSSVAWSGAGFYYSRYPAPSPGKELSSSNEHHRVFYHRLGTSQDADELVFENPSGPLRFHLMETTEDERFEVLYVYDRAAGKKGNAVLVRDRSRPGGRFAPLIAEITHDTFHVIDNTGDTLLVHTDKDAPNGRIVSIDPSDPGELNWKTVVGEKAEPIERASSAGGALFVVYMKDVTARVSVHRLDGTFERDVALPGPGTVEGFSGENGAPFVFYTFTSFTAPSTLYRYDIASRTSAIFRASELPGFDASAFETTQVFVTSKDGTRVPMFLVHRKGIVPDGSNPVLMYGYGGFNVSTTPNFNALRLALLERGFVYASVNMRGGSEYGEAWHDAGTKTKKQNVFDDFIAAAEWLIAQTYSTPARMAMIGASNGGLLVGAVMNQRPDLFRVAVPQVAVMDMLRFHKFTIGWNWAPDYGSSDNPDEFAALYGYSPLHNIRAGIDYPAALIVTADHDDRVVPAHSFKYAATLQAHATGNRPALIRIETKSGHGASNTTKLIEMTADVYAFILHELGIDW
ncbi:MAG: prolyl oligopeptidase family serine peptidase, partial [Vicinamibacterales bacterium]